MGAKMNLALLNEPISQPVKGIGLKDLGPREMCDWFIIM